MNVESCHGWKSMRSKVVWPPYGLKTKFETSSLCHEVEKRSKHYVPEDNESI